MKNQSQPPQHQNVQPGRESKMSPQPEYISTTYHGSKKLIGKTALITGGDSGIGRAIACHYAIEGADIVIQYLNEHDDALKTKEIVEAIGSKCWLFSANLQTFAECEDLISKALHVCSHINILVNNIAEQHVQEDFEDISCEQFENTFKTNVFSYFYMIKALLPSLSRDDVIINTASITAYKGNPRLIDYSASKGAIISLTRSLSQNLIKRQIRVNAVAPGPIWTPLIPASFAAEDVAKFGQQAPMKRVGQPSEVAPSYVFLACDDSSYMTGQVLHPNGGTIVNS